MRCALLPSSLLLVLVACAGSPAPLEAEAPTRRAAPPAGPGDALRGELLFAELGCKGCHGGRGEGGGVGPDLFAASWGDKGREEARATILRGFPDHTPPMPPYEGKVDDEQLDDLLAYITAP